MNYAQSPLRLRKKHGAGSDTQGTAVDGERLIAVQSLPNAIIAGLLVILAFSACWAALSALTNRVFPWATLILGCLIGLAIRRAGRGVDWRFPLVAALLTLFGSLVANIVVAADHTAETFGTGTLELLRATTSMTWPVFFDEVLNAADAIFAAFAATLAAFFANRRLTRAQYFALRLWHEQQSKRGIKQE